MRTTAPFSGVLLLHAFPRVECCLGKQILEVLVSKTLQATSISFRSIPAYHDGGVTLFAVPNLKYVVVATTQSTVLFHLFFFIFQQMSFSHPQALNLKASATDRIPSQFCRRPPLGHAEKIDAEFFVSPSKASLLLEKIGEMTTFKPPPVPERSVSVAWERSQPVQTSTPDRPESPAKEEKLPPVFATLLSDDDSFADFLNNLSMHTLSRPVTSSRTESQPATSKRQRFSPIKDEMQGGGANFSSDYGSGEGAASSGDDRSDYESATQYVTDF